MDHARAGARGAAAAWAYPLVGAVLGAAAGALGWGLQAIGLPAGPAAVAVLAVLVLATGALHEDGLADTADALGGGSDKESRLRIFKDSRIGAFGAAALCLCLLARWSCLAELSGTSLIFAAAATGALSRAVMVGAYWMLPPAVDTGLAAGLGRPPGLMVLLSLAIGGGLMLWLGSPAALLAPFVLPMPLLFLAHRLIGGRNGDVLGAVQQTAEVAALAALVS